MPAPRGSARPSLIEHLNSHAPAKPVNARLSIQKYYGAADLLLRQASLYRSNKNEEQLYVMLMRFASLVIETIPAHKDFSKSDPKYLQLKKILQQNLFLELESVKLSLRTKDAPAPVACSINRPSDVVRLTTSNLPGLNWAAAAAAPPPAPPSDPNVDDLLDILSGKPSAQPGQQAPQQRSDPSLIHVSSLSTPDYQPRHTLSSRQGDNRHALFLSSTGHQSSAMSSHQTSLYQDAAMPRYPSVDNLLLSTASAGPALPGNEFIVQHMQPQPTAGPPLGPQEVEVYSMSAHQHPAGTPGSCSDPCPPDPGPAPPEATPVSTSVGPVEPTKRAALRDVHVSVALMEEFLRFAAANTARGIETCGILAATLSANDSIFTISTLIVPKQKGTSSTVEMMSEEEVLMVHLERELYPLGWIHTHPTQTCFMSSVDVHTQCGYQTMLDEAVAIVMAPVDRNKKCGIFRLTTPGGLSLVQKCDLRGFHTHPETSTQQELYELCGHVYLNDRVKHEVIDLR